MKKVTILALKGSLASSIMGPMDIFSQAGVAWNFIFGWKLTPYFDVEIVSPDGKPVTCFNYAKIIPHRSMRDVKKTDLIIIPAIVDSEKAISLNRATVDWLKIQHRRGATIGSICMGSFLLAETGLLDGKIATTHWAFAQAFRNRYPQVLLRPEKLVTDEGSLLCSGAGSSYLDLCIYLVKKYCGEKVALECAKLNIYDIGRDSQSPYTVYQFKKNHADEQIIDLQKWIEKNYSKEIDMEQLAREYGMSRRTFERRFKNATGETPLTYLQKVRVEAAKAILETSLQTFDEITYKVGYEDSSFFRKIFIKHTGSRPKEYQKRFQSV
jgi:transcriptional regulator GlxA family with amidase domain